MTQTLCHFSGLTLRFDGESVFSDLGATVSPGLTGLVGRNGQGKSVLLQLLAGERQPTGGQIHWTCPRVRVGQLTRLSGPRLADALGVGAWFDCFERIEQGRAEPDDLERVADAWHLPARWTRLLQSAGLDRSLTTPVDTLSGGEQTRLALCRALLLPDHLLLLDEPTNHLDASGRAWLLERLRAHPGGALIASHDRALLRQMDRLLELSPTGLTEYGGGFDLYRSVRDARVAAAEQRVETLRKQRREQQKTQQAALEKAARRRKQGERQRRSGSQSKLLLDARQGRAEGSLSRLKQQQQQRSDALDQSLRDSQASLESVRPQRLSLPEQGVRGGLRIHLDAVILPWGDPDPLSITVHSGERWRISGDNGSGKSTLLKVLARRETAKSGEVGVHGSCLYLDQHFSLLHETDSATDNLRRLYPEHTEGDLRTRLASLRLPGDKALLPVSRLSGGERLKVALLAVTAGATVPDILLLDEPDNHLDLESKALLEQALIGYPGTLLVVSHDSDFIEAIGTDHELALSAIRTG